MIQSKFKLWVLLPVIISLFLSLIIIAGIFSLSGKINFIYFILLLIVFCFFVLMLIWLVWGELRTKALKVSIEADSIFVKNFMGLGISIVIHFSEIDGFKTAVLPTQYNEYEYLYLIKGKQKLIKLSEFYHKNYPDLKREISEKCKNLGTEIFSLSRELKEIFS